MVPTGEFGVVPANKIIAAIGNKPDLPVIKSFGVSSNDDGYIAVKDTPYGMTSKEASLLPVISSTNRRPSSWLCVKDERQPKASISI